jgi:hypothetical protein
MAIVINDSNKAAINLAIPLLNQAYVQVVDFVEATETALTDASQDPSTWVGYTMSLTRTGYLSVTYLRLDVVITWNVGDAVWEITSIKETCEQAVESI